MNIKIKSINKENCFEIVRLFSNNGNPYHWTVDKWSHYYEQYPFKGARSFAAVIDGKTVGHYGVVPVNIGGYKALLGLHAYVKEDFRNLKVINLLLKKVYEYAKKNDYDFICGFSNHNFSKVLSDIFKWDIVGYLSFDNVKHIENNIYDLEKYKYYFQYTDEWYLWKFRYLSDVYINKYIKDDKTYNQLLKLRNPLSCNKVKEINFWNPKKFLKVGKEGWTQPFLIKKINVNVKDSLLNPQNWFIEMGDSDTFEAGGV